MTLTFEEATSRIVALARDHDGTVTAADVERDDVLTTDRDVVNAAARALAGSTNVFSVDEPDERDWFPYSSLTFSELPSRR